MRLKFGPETAFGIITLLVCLPVAAVLAYIFAVYYNDALRDFVRRPPTEIALTFAVAVVFVGVVVYRRRRERR